MSTDPTPESIMSTDAPLFDWSSVAGGIIPPPFFPAFEKIRKYSGDGVHPILKAAEDNEKPFTMERCRQVGIDEEKCTDLVGKYDKLQSQLQKNAFDLSIAACEETNEIGPLEHSGLLDAMLNQMTDEKAKELMDQLKNFKSDSFRFRVSHLLIASIILGTTILI